MGAHHVTLSLLELAARDMGSSADGSDPEQDKAPKPKPKASGKLKRGVSLYSLSGAPTGVSSPFALRPSVFCTRTTTCYPYRVETRPLFRTGITACCCFTLAGTSDHTDLFDEGLRFLGLFMMDDPENQDAMFNYFDTIAGYLKISETAGFVLKAMISGNIDHARVAGLLYPGVVKDIAARIAETGRSPYFLEFICEFASVQNLASAPAPPSAVSDSSY